MRTDYLSATAANPPFDQSATIFDGNIDNPTGGTQRAFPPNIAGIRSEMPTPRITSFNLGVQHEILSGTILHANYVGTLGDNLTRTVNINQLRAGTRLNPPASTTNVNALRPYPGYGNIIDHRERRRVELSQPAAVADAAAPGGPRVRRQLHLLEDARHLQRHARRIRTTSRATMGCRRFTARTTSTAISSGSCRSSARRQPVARGVLGGWDVSGVVVYQSGAPFTVTAPVDAARIGTNSTRATLIGDPSLPAERAHAGAWFNTAAFLNPALMTPGEFGNSARKILIGPSFSRVDLSLSKRFALGPPRETAGARRSVQHAEQARSPASTRRCVSTPQATRPADSGR